MATKIQLVKFDRLSGETLARTEYPTLDAAYEANEDNYYGNLGVGYSNDTYVAVVDTESNFEYKITEPRRDAR